MEDRKEQKEEFPCVSKGFLNRVSLLKKTVGHPFVCFKTTYDFVSLNSVLSCLHLFACECCCANIIPLWECIVECSHYLTLSLTLSLIILGPVQTGTERNGTERNRSKKWNAEGLRSDGTTSNRTVPFQKLDLFNK